MWKREKRDEKWTKIPYTISGSMASSTNAKTWASFDVCVAAVGGFDGIGFVFSGGVVGIDLDHCFGGDGEVLPWAKEVLERFQTYTERSPSGDGLHVIVESDAEFKGRNMKIAGGNGAGIECYMTGRFFTVTGDVFDGRGDLRDCDVMEWYGETFPKDEVREVVEIKTVSLPDDETIKRVMFHGKKTGKKWKEIYEEGRWREHGYESQSQGDQALVNTIMFYCCNDKVTADRLFRKSDMFRDKWDEYRGKETYGEKTLARGIQKEVMKWKKRVEYIMSSGDEPVPMLILENICRAIDSDDELNERFRFNDFSHMIEVSKDDIWRTMQDSDVLEAQRYISTQFSPFARVSKEMTVDAIRSVAGGRRVNPPVDYLNSLVWDGVPRVDKWLVEAFGTPDDDLHHAMGSNWLKGLVKRVLEPGCLFDEVLVLEGKQGMRKSTSLRILGRPWHTECTLSTDDKDFYMLMARSVIVEFSEGDIVGRTSAQKLKAVITKTEDTFRPPYEHGMLTFKRSCVFAMTTNSGDYQKDDTGGRRWLPVVLGKVADTGWLERYRDQLFAEAVHRVRSLRETTHEYPADALASIQEEKMEEDVYDEPVRDWYDSLPSFTREKGIRIVDVYENVVMNGKETNREVDKRMEWRLASLVKRVLKLNRVVIKEGGKTIRRWK